ncbi:unnamed protein product [Arctia plantaginis]|uniref:NHR domain-containing protein n=1 Tax=Arctia plantaginis TaxID=874455 RepID=A0A8S0ZEW2_ARCPL|nr:unnamed protein product [Arctia plantaginis]
MCVVRVDNTQFSCINRACAEIPHIIMAGGRNSSTNKKHSKFGGKTQYKSEEQKRGEEKKNETIKKENANQKESSGLKYENKKKDQIENAEPLRVTEKEENKTVDRSCHDSATDYSQVKPCQNEIELKKEVSDTQTDVTDNKENRELEIDAERNEQIDDPRRTNVTNSVFPNHLDQERGDETVPPATPAVQSHSINDVDDESKVSDELKYMRKNDQSEEVPDDDKADTNMTLDDKKISDDQLNPQEIKPEQPIKKENANQRESSSLKCENKRKDQIENAEPIEVTERDENKTVDRSCHDSETDNNQVKPCQNEIELKEEVCNTQTDVTDDKENSKLEIDAERNEQIDDPRRTNVTKSVFQNHIDQERGDETVHPQKDGTHKCIQNYLRDQNIEYLRDLFRPLILEALQNIIPSYSQNAKGLEKKPSEPVVDKTNNIKDMKDQLQNKREPSDQPQNENKATERLQNTKERNDHFQDDKEPNDQCQSKQVPTEQFQNEKKTFDQFQKPKEEVVQNIIVSSPQNAKGLEKELSQTIGDKSNGIKELNDQLQNGELKNGEPMRDDQLQTPKEIKPIRFMQKPEDGEILYAEDLQIFIQSIVPELIQILEKMFSHRRRSSGALKSETKSSLAEDSQIPSNELDVHSLFNPNIEIITTDIPNFECTRIEESDKVKGHDEVISTDPTGIQIKKSQVVDQQNRELKELEEELKEEVRRNDEVLEANDSIVKTNGSLDLVTTFGTTYPEIKPLQEPMRFHAVHGDNISLSKNNFRAQRKKKSNFFSKGIAFSSRPVAVGEKVSFHLRQLSSYWLGLITIGFTTNDPMSIADNLPTNVIDERDCADGFWAEHLDKKYYQESCRLHFYLNSSGNMCFGVNGVDKIEFFWNLETTTPVWALIDVFGYFTIVEFDIPKELHNTSFVASSLLSGRNESDYSMSQYLDDNEKYKPCLNYQIRFVPLNLYTQVEGTCMKFLEDRGVCVTLGNKGGCIDGKLPLFPGQTIVVQNLSVGKALFYIGVKYGSPTTEVSSQLPEPVKSNFVMHVKDELAITFTETGEIRVTKNLDVPKTILKVNRSQELWPFVQILKRNQMIKMWSSSTPFLAAFQT